MFWGQVCICAIQMAFCISAHFSITVLKFKIQNQKLNWQKYHNRPQYYGITVSKLTSLCSQLSPPCQAGQCKYQNPKHKTQVLNSVLGSSQKTRTQNPNAKIQGGPWELTTNSKTQDPKAQIPKRCSGVGICFSEQIPRRQIPSWVLVSPSLDF